MSDEQTPQAEAPQRKGWPKGKPRTARASSEASTQATGTAAGAPSTPPVVQVTSRRNAALARRLAPGANPHGVANRTIPLNEPSRWQLYIANDYNGADDLYRMVHEYGWTPLAPEDLACKPEDIGYRINESNHLVRGPQGREVIFKMDKVDYRELMQRKTERNNKGIGSASKTRTQVAEAASNAFGAEAADFIYKNVKGTVTDTQEPVI